MNRVAFVFRVKPGKKEAFLAEGAKLWGEAEKALDGVQMTNFSIWSISDFMFCYGETPDDVAAEAVRAAVDGIAAKLTDTAEVLAEPGTMRLMYHDYGIVREDKSLIRHRVFATHLKPGCAEEYKRRHDGLIEQRGDTVDPGPDSNFSIWSDGTYIFGYNEIDTTMEKEETPEEHAATVEWETRQLGIMDWITNDCDWLTGEIHAQSRRIAWHN